MNIELIKEQAEKAPETLEISKASSFINVIVEAVEKFNVVAPLTEDKKIDLMEKGQKLSDIYQIVHGKYNAAKEVLFSEYQSLQKPLSALEKTVKAKREQIDTFVINFNSTVDREESEAYVHVSKGVKNDSGSYSVKKKNSIDGEVDVLKVLKSYSPAFLEEYFTIKPKASFVKYYEDMFGKDPEKWGTHPGMTNKNEGPTPGIKIKTTGASISRSKK